MGWQFVYCPECGAPQVKIGGCREVMFCRECCTEWAEGRKDKKGKK